MYIIVGLGNPGSEYEMTRHNTGRIVVDAIRKKGDFSEWKEDKKKKAMVSAGSLSGGKATLILPQTFMNKSGESLKGLITSKKKAETLVVVHDDLDLPLGTLKMSFNRGSGGHRGVESIIRAIKTETFIRLRVGISLSDSKGRAKKPNGEKAVSDFILHKFKDSEQKILSKVSRKAVTVAETLLADGRERATEICNQN
ncbi:MAG: aminoacyl-tRNA hydrolase [Patescibacteria group bacterium]|nr:aminoacyl-tRNA hydrolase [bacterium]MDZ4240522.1 aminoacyl-tRNA hydrolase [Patescibacteria group bacterium]